MTDRATVAEDLVRWHFKTDDDLEEVYVYLGEGDEPIRFLEINASVVSREVFEPFGFAPTAHVPFPTSIALVTREELERLRPKLPASWREDRIWRRFKRPQHAG